METLKLAIVTDIHHGINSYGKVGEEALGLLASFTKEVNEQGADLVIDLGDRINDANREADFKLEQEVSAVFNQLTVPHVHLLGNHDLEFLSREDNTHALGLSVANQSRDMKGYHLVFWQPDANFDTGFYATGEQLEWLKADLAATTLPTIIFTHAPFSESSMISHFYFENAAKDKAGYGNARLIRNIIHESNVVIACISGHVHWNSLNTLNGIHHITLQSLTESWTTQGEAARSWTWLELSNALHVTTRGQDPYELILPIKQLGQNWREPIVFDA